MLIEFKKKYISNPFLEKIFYTSVFQKVFKELFISLSL